LTKKFTRTPQFYGFYSLIIILGAGVVFPQFPLLSLSFTSRRSSEERSALCPYFFMLLLINDKKVMMEVYQRPIFNSIA